MSPFFVKMRESQLCCYELHWMSRTYVFYPKMCITKILTIQTCRFCAPVDQFYECFWLVRNEYCGFLSPWFRNPLQVHMCALQILSVKMVGFALVNKLKPNLNVLLVFARKTNGYFVSKLLIGENAIVKFMLLAVKRLGYRKPTEKYMQRNMRIVGVGINFRANWKSRQNGTISMA